MNRPSAWQEAYDWLCRQRKNAPSDSDVWHLRFHWATDGEAFRNRVEQGKYRLKPLRVVKRAGDDPIALWDADDALVLKWVALQLQDVMPVHPTCHHVKGAGVHHSRRAVKEALDSGEYAFVYRTDIRGYYQHMQKSQLNALADKWVKDPILRDLITQYIGYSVEEGGEFHTPANGISRGCALSPLLGASLLFHVDALFAGQTELFYVRYMDDFLVLSKKRWPLRRAIRLLNEQMHAGGFALHPDKTQIGRLDKGFEWLGLWIDKTGVRRSARSWKTRATKLPRLYEQARTRAGRAFFNLLSIWGPTVLLLGLPLSSPSFSAVVDLGVVGPGVTGTPDRSGTIINGNYSNPHVTAGRTSYADVEVVPPFVIELTESGRHCLTSVPASVINVRTGPYSYGMLAPGFSGFPLTTDIPANASAGVILDYNVLGGACRYTRAVSGPFTETVGTLNITVAGSKIYSEDLIVSGVWQVSTCSVTSVTYDFGDMTPGAAGHELGTMDVPVQTACNPKYPSELPATVTFSSPYEDTVNSGFTDPALPGVALQMRDASTSRVIEPGTPVPYNSGSGFNARLVQTGTNVSGAFNIVVDVTLSYD